MSETTGSGGNYDPTKLAGQMRLSEAEIYYAALAFGYVGRLYQGEYESVNTGDVVTIHTEVTKRSRDFKVYIVELSEVVVSQTAFAGAMGTPPSKIWEGKFVLDSSGATESGGECFGFMAPGGFVILVDSAPEDETTNLRIINGFQLSERGELEV